ncbi:uncharacterized protein VP01_7698g2 [Puccinia sorghi]|uniref:Uncharacterized protein n=1 Tax=Puccinia sorghi TaxID=27349 RepID=A0A0L6UBK8_9BASI|nr:uncharacterized protein VP01_7698g2 [Puccinia sorghi]
MPKKASPNPQNPRIRSQPSDEKDYLVIIEWLKIERNYNSCFGTGKAPAVGRPEKG